MNNETTLPKLKCFWRGPLSQWSSHTFSFCATKYMRAEQFMMSAKAYWFGDATTLEKIMATSNPKEHQQLGRQVANFVEASWKDVRFSIVYTACYLKATQNPDILKMVLEEEADLFVEGSPFDKVWGVGIDENDPLILDPKNWKGLNLLGQAWTDVRDYLRDPSASHMAHHKHIHMVSNIFNNTLS